MQMPNAMLNKYIGHKDGGMMKAVDADKNPGLSKLPTEVRNKMGYMKKGGMAHSDMAQDMPMMKKVAKQEVKSHEKRMHNMASGGKVAQLNKANGIAVKGKSKGTMIKMKGC
jgi:carbonic anhydrase